MQHGEAPHLDTLRARNKATSPHSPEDSEHQPHLLHRTTPDRSVAIIGLALVHVRPVSVNPLSVRASPTRLGVQPARFDEDGWTSRLEYLDDEAICGASAPHDNFNWELWTLRTTAMPNRNQPGKQAICPSAEPIRQPASTKVTVEPAQRVLGHSDTLRAQSTAEQQPDHASYPHAPTGERLIPGGGPTAIRASERKAQQREPLHRSLRDAHHCGDNPNGKHSGRRAAAYTGPPGRPRHSPSQREAGDMHMAPSRAQTPTGDSSAHVAYQRCLSAPPPSIRRVRPVDSPGTRRNDSVAEAHLAEVSG